MDAVTAPDEPRMRFAVLGPVRAWHGDDPVDMGSPQQRALLAALLLRRGRTATIAELIDSMWGDEPPSQGVAVIRTYASRLRKRLSPQLLISESGGYAVRVAPGALDLELAEELAADAEKAQLSGDLGGARELLDRALGLWDGEPLANLPGPYADAQRSRLEEWRLQLLETRLQLDLDSGCHAEAVSELTALTAAHPLRERLRELLMLALYRSGRQAEALAVYADTRRLLADELGVDPRPGLAELQQRILRADPDLAGPGPAAPHETEQPALVRPSQLPATVADFTGRAAFVQELAERLAARDGRAPRVMAVSAVAGIGGVGKTTLAVHAAHAARSAFPDGQLYVDLRGAGPVPAEPRAVLGSFLRALGTQDAAVPDSLEDRAALYRSTLDGRRVLVLLDDARDATQVRPLLPGADGCAALVTSRARLVDLPGAHLVDLDVLSPEEAVLLFARIVGEERVAAEREACLDVVAACGFLPLAIRIAASRLAARRTWTVAVLAAKLADERRRLDELHAGDLAVEATFELGYGQLEPERARAFRLLGLADGPDLSLAAAAAVLDRPVQEAEDLLESLVDTSLLESAAPGRYRFHDLVRLYARACAERDGDRGDAVPRLAHFHLATAARAYEQVRPGARVLDHITRPRYDAAPPAGRQDALDWLFGEAESLLAVVEQSAQDPALVPVAADLLYLAQDLLESGAYARRYEWAARAVVAAAVGSGDPRAEGRARLQLARAHLFFDRVREADGEAARALSLARAAGDLPTEGFAGLVRGAVALREGRARDGRARFEALAREFFVARHRYGEAAALVGLSRAQVELGDHRAALVSAERAGGVCQALGTDLFFSAHVYLAQGVALTAAGRPGEALVALGRALPLFRGARQRIWEGVALHRTAEAEVAAGHFTRGAALAEEALTALHGGSSWPYAQALRVLAEALDGLGRHERARVCRLEALKIFERLGTPYAAAAGTRRAPRVPGGTPTRRRRLIESTLPQPTTAHQDAERPDVERTGTERTAVEQPDALRPEPAHAPPAPRTPAAVA